MTIILPAVLAAPPWVPTRKRRKLVLPTRPEPEPRIVWSSPDEQAAWRDPTPGMDPSLDKLAPLPPDERDRTILTAVASPGILPLYAGRHLSLEAMRIALEKAQPAFLRHYQFAHIALARFGLEVLSDLVALADRVPDVAMDCFRHIDAPIVADKLAAKYVDFAEEWYGRFPETAARRLLPIALTGNAKDSAHALRLVARLIAAGHENTVMAEAHALGDDAVLELRDLLAPAPLPPKPPALPSFVDLPTLPRPRFADGAPLADEHVERLVQLFACLPLGAAREALAGAAMPSVKDACDSASLGDLLRALVDRWVDADAPSKEKWVLFAAALLGDDLVMHRLAEGIAAWADAGKHPRVAAGVEALAGVGSDVALLHLHRFAEKAKSKNLKKRAAAALAEYREEHGLSEDALADRIVPDLGLDAHGELALSYGPRAFRVVFDEAAKIALREGDKPLRSLPKPAPGDDPQLAERARATWDTLKKETPRVVDAQLRRLERAMARQRTWTRDELERYHLYHPLMQHLARRLVWAAYDARGRVVLSFRIAEDGTYAGADDATVTLPDAARFGIPHPLALGRDAAARWGDVFGDYQIVQPFPQLARETFVLDDAETNARTLVRFAGARVEGSRFYALKHRGWEFFDYEIGKRLADGASVTLATEPGLQFLASKPEDQILGDVTLHGAATFGALGAIEASEVVRDVELLRR